MKKFALAAAPLFLASALLLGCGVGTPTDSSQTEVESSVISSETSTTTSSESVHEHSYVTVDLVAPTNEAVGASDYVICEECEKIFNSKHEEITSVPELPVIDAPYTVCTVGSLGSVVTDKINIFDDTHAVPMDEFLDNTYLVGVDAEGVVIYAGRFGGAGYGGPGDGFYHDGTYAPVAGEVCGIFDLDPQWAHWPATVDLDGDGIAETNAWTLFDLVVPAGGYIIAGDQTYMADIMTDLAGVDKEAFLAETNNAIFETQLADGELNKTKQIEVAKGDAQAAVYVHTLTPPVVSGVFYKGTQAGSMTETEEGSGIYILDIELATWNNVSLYKIAEDGTETEIWYDNTTVSGFVIAADASGADWTVRLYHEGGKVWITSTGGNYRFIYDNNFDTLEILTKGLVASGATGDADYKDYVILEDGDTVYTKALATWGNIELNVYGADLTKTHLWYDTVTVSGDVTAADVTGADWTVNLYHEDEVKWVTCTGGTYTFTYNAANATLAIAGVE